MVGPARRYWPCSTTVALARRVGVSTKWPRRQDTEPDRRRVPGSPPRDRQPKNPLQGRVGLENIVKARRIAEAVNMVSQSESRISLSQPDATSSVAEQPKQPT